MVLAQSIRYSGIRHLSYASLRSPAFYAPVKPVIGSRLYSDVAKDAASETGSAEAAKETLSEEQQKIQDLEKKLGAKDKECAEYKDRLLRSVADFRNLQELTKKDVQKAKDFALQKFAKDLLDSVDNFGHALNAFKPETTEQSTEISDLYTGVKMTRDVFEKTLKKHGIEKLDPMGEAFDPHKHEATFELPDPEKEPGTVFHVQQVGFTLNDRVIRPAKVGIVKDVSN
ncbi:LADA_0C07360g1_1 [Lachancea dasiensis]|uniref:GrpE protein homolog n=1 Tax=Lachancea dasiensis TaxID=1072105 RepID=A0A1G4IZH4_9SACH|nr:LADA_0C07360g1_1 [Lachancea dasiensis]